MKKQFSILAIMAAILLAALAASPVGATSGKGEVIGVIGIVPGQDLMVHIVVLVPPGADRNEVAREALANQGARAITKEEFSTISITWDQFDVIGDGDDFVEQYYNPADQPADVSREQLTNSQETWTGVATSVFAFYDAGDTDRCPSLVKECRGRQTFDGNNDVAWLALKGGNILGVTWSGTSIDEADMALNINFNWATDNVNDYDVETVFLHENGHALGLGHSEDILAVMYPSYQGIARSLTADDVAGVTFKYPAPGALPLTISTTAVADGIIGESYSETLQAFGGVTPYAWAVTLGSLPAGLNLNGATGEITGTPTTLETQGFTVQVTDGESATDSAILSITVADAPVAAISVGVVEISYATAGGKNKEKNLRITLSVADNFGNAVASAAVSIELSNDTSGGPWTGTASTGTDGTVTFQLRNAPDGHYTTLVTGISAAGLAWNLDDGSTVDPGFDKLSGNNNRGNSGALETP